MPTCACVPLTSELTVDQHTGTDIFSAPTAFIVIYSTLNPNVVEVKGFKKWIVSH